MKYGKYDTISIFNVFLHGYLLKCTLKCIYIKTQNVYSKIDMLVGYLERSYFSWSDRCGVWIEDTRWGHVYRENRKCPGNEIKGLLEDILQFKIITVLDISIVYFHSISIVFLKSMIYKYIYLTMRLNV